MTLVYECKPSGKKVRGRKKKLLPIKKIQRGGKSSIINCLTRPQLLLMRENFFKECHLIKLVNSFINSHR